MKINFSSIAFIFLIVVIAFAISAAAYADPTDFVTGYNLSSTTGWNATYSPLVNNNGVAFVPGIATDNASNFTAASSRYYNLSTNLGITTGNISFSWWIEPKTLPSSGNSEMMIWKGSMANVQYTIFLNNNGGSQRIYIDHQNTGVGDYSCFYNATMSTTSWTHLVLTYDGFLERFFVNGTQVVACVASGAGSGGGVDRFALGADNQGAPSSFYDGLMQSVYIFNRNLSQSEITALYNSAAPNYPFINVGSFPNISNILCTSCNVPFGSNTSPYVTDDTTPTFNFTTTVSANCSISNVGTNYSTMSSSEKCSTGEGTITHTCTLSSADEITYWNQTIYAACINAINASAAVSVSLPMYITSLDTNATRYIVNGIGDSVIGAAARIYQNQQVYLRAINNSQLLATVNVVASYGNQRWLFNYANDTQSLLGLFNLSPAVYVLEFKNVSLTNIRLQTAAYINSTKN